MELLKYVTIAFVGAMLGANNEECRAWCQSVWHWVTEAVEAGKGG